MADIAIEAEGLIKRYGRGTDAKTALTGLDLTVNQGEVFGFLGPNGAGKSTTIRLIVDLIRPTGGRLRVLGADPRAAVAARARIGYLPGDFIVDGRQTPRELLTYLGALRGGVPSARIEALADRFDLDLSRRIGALSKGNRQKVGLVQAFMHHPDLLVLDEPTSGLDPFLQHQFVDLVREASADGQTVFMSSHVMSEVQQTCHRAGIIREGALVTVTDIDELRARAQRKITIMLAGPVDPQEFSVLPELHDVNVAETAGGGSILHATLSGSPNGLLKAAARHDVTDLLAEEPELEELFFSVYDQGLTT